jgi:hypothetical protein
VNSTEQKKELLSPHQRVQTVQQSIAVERCVTRAERADQDVTGSVPSVTDYIFAAPAKFPNCKREILEKTLIEPACN